mmetsp:Transcript_9093/g.22167  ORF Transcript_9093/g.22167 Transcript_9093/m.22167 type:complete len:808 (-) Transcript_9093:74-2497(-)
MKASSPKKLQGRGGGPEDGPCGPANAGKGGWRESYLSGSLAKVKRRVRAGSKSSESNGGPLGRSAQSVFSDGGDDGGTSGSGRSVGGVSADPDRRGSNCADTQNLFSCIDVVESIAALQGLTPEQRTALQQLRSAALRSSGGNLENPDPRRRSMSRRSAFSKGASNTKMSPLLTDELLRCFAEVEQNEDDTDQRCNTTAVLANYGGQVFQGVSAIAPRIFGGNARAFARKVLEGDSQSSLTSSRRDAAVGLTPLRDSMIPLDLNMATSENLPGLNNKVYCPPEWNALPKGARTRLTEILSWENLSDWGFDVREVAKLSKETLRNPSMDFYDDKKQLCPLLFVGWAILCAPMAQHAMEGSLGDKPCDEDTKREDDNGPSLDGDGCLKGKEAFPYNFSDDLAINPERICNFLREIERGYKADNWYHNNTHAADVTQTMHCLLQFIGKDKLSKIYDSVQLFSILLAATFHDVGHTGMNNMFEQNARTPLAIRYNDVSVLENMHSSVGHSYLMGENKRDEWDVFRDWKREDVIRARTVMMGGVLGTDMSMHFKKLGELAGLVEKVRANDKAVGNTRNSVLSGVGEMTDEGGANEKVGRGKRERPILDILAGASELGDGKEASLAKKECTCVGDLLLKFLLHSADISNPTKKQDLAVYWAEGALAEFFKQGDEEEKLGIPISPLCDRRTVKKADSQIGFLKFVVRPTYALLGEILPTANDKVMPIIDQNISYWTGEKRRLSLITSRSSPTIIPNIKFKYQPSSNRLSIEEERDTKDDDTLDGSSNNNGSEGEIVRDKNIANSNDIDDVVAKA